MARTVVIDSKIYPNDIRKDYGTLGVLLPMNGTNQNSNSQLFNMSFTTEEQAISNLINLLLTKDGERFMRPRFGVGLYFYVFEQNTPITLLAIESAIEEQVGIWLPYINLIDVSVTGVDDSFYDGNGINIVITFKVNNSGSNRQISIYNLNDVQLNVEVQ